MPCVYVILYVCVLNIQPSIKIMSTFIRSILICVRLDTDLADL